MGSTSVLPVCLPLHPLLVFLLPLPLRVSPQRHGRGDSGRRRLHCAASERCWRRAGGSAAGPRCRPLHEGAVVRMRSATCLVNGRQARRVTHYWSVCRVLVDELSKSAIPTPGVWCYLCWMSKRLAVGVWLVGLAARPCGYFTGGWCRCRAHTGVLADYEGLAVPTILCMNDCLCRFLFGAVACV